MRLESARENNMSPAVILEIVAQVQGCRQTSSFLNSWIAHVYRLLEAKRTWLFLSWLEKFTECSFVATMGNCYYPFPYILPIYINYNNFPNVMRLYCWGLISSIQLPTPFSFIRASLLENSLIFSSRSNSEDFSKTHDTQFFFSVIFSPMLNNASSMENISTFITFSKSVSHVESIVQSALTSGWSPSFLLPSHNVPSFHDEWRPPLQSSYVCSFLLLWIFYCRGYGFPHSFIPTAFP